MSAASDIADHYRPMASGRYLVILESAEHGGLLPMKSQPPASACTVRHKYGSAQKGPRAMAKRYGRPSLHYRYEHYDPR
jgi:hypothetical protein